MGLVPLAATPALAQEWLVGPVAIISDPAGDQETTSGTLVTTPPAFDNVDILSVTAAQGSPESLTLAVVTKASASDTQNFTVAFTVAPGPTSLPNSTASGASHTLLYHAGAVSGIPGATAIRNGTQMAFGIPLAAVGAVGGDILSNVSVTTADHEAGSGIGISQDDSSSRDMAPNSGTSQPFTFTRPPRTGNITLAATDGQWQVADAPVQALSGNETRLDNGTAVVTFRLQVTNHALDPDTVHLETNPIPGTHVATAPSTLNLAPGGTGSASITVTLDDVPDGTLRLVVRADSALGGRAEEALLIHVERPPVVPPAPREPVPAALGFLTPVVTAVGLDHVFGAYAELAFLLFVLLVAVVTTYLVMFTVHTPWVRVRITPRKVVVAPGGVAEFHVEMAGRNARPTLARATLRSLGTWTAGVQVGREAARSGESMDIPLESGKDALPQEGVLRVQVPYDASANDRQDLEFDVVPLDAEGGLHPQHATRAKLTVEAAPPVAGRYASARDIRLADVSHDPSEPRPGATVRTTALIHNDGPVTAKLRVVLQKDGIGVAEERVDVPPNDARNVALPWTAGAGRNMVKVQIFLA